MKQLAVDGGKSPGEEVDVTGPPPGILAAGGAPAAPPQSAPGPGCLSPAEAQPWPLYKPPDIKAMHFHVSNIYRKYIERERVITAKMARM